MQTHIDEPLSANASFKERHAAQRTREFAELRAATRAIEAHAAANPPTLRALEELEDIPDGYRAATENRQPVQSDITPDCWPGYDPYGKPACGYDLALALRHLNKEDAAARTPPARTTPAAPVMLRDANGIPDGYATALAARRNA